MNKMHLIVIDSCVVGLCLTSYVSRVYFQFCCLFCCDIVGTTLAHFHLELDPGLTP